MNRALLLQCTAVAGIAACGGGSGTPDAGPIDAAQADAAPDAAASGPFVPPAAGPDLTGAANPYDWTGYSVASAGDVNGDGHADMMVSALAARREGGRVTVFYGPLTANKTPAEASVTFTGEWAYSNLGESMAHAGGCDVNRDGFDDLVLGAPFADVVSIAPNPNTSGDNRGKAYLFLGSATLSGAVNAAAAAVKFTGTGESDAAGSTTACLGDLDGDGYDDLAIAARRHGTTGAVYLVYGRASFPATVELASADAILVGESGFDNAGVAVAPAGDANGDGRPDFLVGAPMSDAGAADAGAVYLVTGTGRRLAGEVRLATQPRLIVKDAGRRLGWSLDRAGDVDGDGVDDVVLGSSSLSDATGAAWLVRGGRDLSGDIDVDLAARGTRLDGTAAGDGAGIGVAGVGDLDRDGKADLAIGAVFAAGTSSSGSSVASAGRTYLVLGRASRPASLSLAQAAWTQGGPAADAYYGETLAGLGDVDADGHPDFAVTSRGTTVGTTIHSGVVHVFRGQPQK